MPEWAETLTVAEAILTVGIIVAGLGGLWGIVKWIYPVMAKLSDFLDDWRGEPPRPDGMQRPGVLERLKRVEDGQQQVAALAFSIDHNVRPNSGSSAHDQLMAKLDCLDRKMGALSDRMDESEEDRRRIHAVIDVVGPVRVSEVGNETGDNGNETRTNIEQEGS